MSGPGDEQQQDEQVEPEAGTEAGQPGADPGADPDDEAQIAEEREQRLDPENRPDNVEVDNTDREFDATKGMFTDSDGFEAAEERFPEPGEQGA